MTPDDRCDSMPPVRVLLIDDSEVFSRSLMRMFADHAEIEVVGWVRRGDAGISIARRLAPEVVVLDLSLPDTSGWQVAAALRQAEPRMRVVVHSSHDAAFHRDAARAANALFIPKSRAATELVAAVLGRTPVAPATEASRQIGPVLEDHRGSDTSTPARGALAALRESEARFRATFEQAAVGMAHVAVDGRWLRVNQKLCDILGQSREALLEMTFRDMTHPDDLESDLGMVRQVLDGLIDTYAKDKRYIRKDGSVVWVHLTVALARTPAGVPDYFISVTQDISESKRAAEALQAKTEEFERYFDDALDLLCIADRKGRLLRFNAQWTSTLGYPRIELEGRSFFDLVHPDDLAATMAALSGLESGDAATSYVGRCRCRDGSYRWMDWRSRLVGTQMHAVARDVTERIQAEEASSTAQRLLSESQAVAQIGSWSVELSTMRLSWSDQMYRLYGVSPETFDHTSDGFFRLVHSDDRPAMLAWLAAVVDGRKPAHLDFRVGRPDGRNRYIRGQGVLQHESGKPSRVVGTAQDITEHRAMEAQFRHAQKMEAVGRLAGGVAHDFNNLLCVILSHAEFAGDGLRAGHPLLEELREIKNAGMRAAALTRQLLAFSRRQVLEPRVVDLNQVATDLDKMLRRLIGEDIELALTLAPELGMVHADPGQLEQVITNLVVNARDAIPSGGKITVETSDVDLGEDFASRHHGMCPGRFVRLVVSDTGHGMDDATMQHLFEPFFTTKEQGRGTGLGLSTVYGIVRQSGGEIQVHSTPNVGTTFEVFLPRITGLASAVARPDDPRAMGTETIVVVEDDEAVLGLTARFLRGAGFQVLTAANGNEALRVVEQHRGEIHLLVTDVVMPHMSGPQVAERLTRTFPGLRVLYMSGYTDDTIGSHGLLEQGSRLIRKPFSAAELTHKVRNLLDESPRR